MKFYRKKFTWKKILAVLLAIISFAAVVFGLVKLGNYLKEDSKKQISNFDRGGLDANTGEYFETNESIYTKNSFSAKGLEIKLDFDSNITYQVFWYDELGEFTKCSEVMTKGSKFYTPFNHEARIMITPQWETGASEDEKEIKWHEVFKYANQLEICVDKNQSVTKDEYYDVTLDSNLFTKAENKAIFQSSNGELVESEGATTYWFTSDGSVSLLYVKETGLEEGDGGVLCLRLKDGSTVYYYSSTQPSADGESPLPTFEKPLYIPYGASVYFYSYFGDRSPADVVLAIY